MKITGVLLSILLGIMVIGLFGIQDADAITYDIIDDELCGGIDEAIVFWDEDEEACFFDDDFTLEDGDVMNIASDVTIFIDGSEIVIDDGGVINNLGIIQNGGDIINEGTINNSGTLQHFEGNINGGGDLNNSLTGTITNGDLLSIGGTFDNQGIINNFGPLNVPLGGFLINSGIMHSIDDGEFIIIGTFTNTGSYDQAKSSFIVKGLVETSGTINLTLDTIAEVSGTGTLNIDDGTFTNDVELVLKAGGTINIDGTLDNTGTLPNECGTINVTGILTNPPIDECPIISITIDSPPNKSKHGDVVPVTFTGTALDIDEFGSEVDISEDIVWTNDKGALVDNIGSSVSNTLPILGDNKITATITDSGGNFLSTKKITVKIFVDNDGDGHLSPNEGNDCDDNDPLINPDAPELYGDLVDNNCDGSVDEGFTDADSDTYVLETLNVLPGFTDCDDTEFTVNPGADELVDGVDTDCNAGTTNFDEVDGDNDTYIPGVIDLISGWLGPGPTPSENDCDDTIFNVNPGVAEIFGNGIDDNCNELQDADDGFTDADEDGYALETVNVLLGFTDCNDAEFDINPGVAEIFGNGIDDNCNGEQDEGFTDADGDGFQPPADCDDADFNVNPGVEEIFGNGIDDNCNGEQDEGFTDADGDGFLIPEDCNNNDATVFPGAPELLDFKDNNCNGLIDEGFDEDGDGFLTGDEESPDTDCDDNDPKVFPGAQEIFGNGIDDNCDGVQDEEKIISPVFQADLTNKQIHKFEKLVDKWEHKIDKLNEQITKLNEKADKKEAKGQTEKAEKIRAHADSKSEKVEILEDNIAIVKISIGEVPVADVLVHFQDKLTEKTVKKINKQIEKYQKTIDRLNYLADKFDEKADKKEDKGKQEKADKLFEKASSLRAKAAINEDLQQVLICATNFEPSDDHDGHHHHDDDD